MYAIFLFCLFLLVAITFMLSTYSNFRSTRDVAYLGFFTVTAVLTVVMLFGFLHFEPWKVFYDL